MTTPDLTAVLRDRGYRVTRQRRAVWNALVEADRHVTVEEVADLVAAQGEDADLASLYRALALFEELGLARMTRLSDRDASRWELSHPDEHFHLVCRDCGSVDHHVGTLVADIIAHLDDGHGFEVEEVDLVVTGRCGACRQPRSKASA